MSARRGVAVTALVLLLAGCGLPLPDGVQSAGDVQPQRDAPAVIEVLPPGPQPGASPEQIVSGFLNAQSSPADDHAVAREFLAPGVEWDDEAGAVIYDLRSRRFAQDPAAPMSFAVRFQTIARISADGSYSLESEPGIAAYTVAQQPDGEFRLVDVPPGLLLTTGDRDRSFEPYNVFFLARDADGSAAARLVPDRVFLPVTAEVAQALVERLLGGASDALGGAVDSAAPAGTTAAVSESDEIVTVDLSAQAQALQTRERQRLAAQLVWTLVPTFSGVRLLVEGRPLDVPGAGEVQDRSDWQEYAPVGTRSDEAPELYYVQDRVLRTLGREALPASEATAAGGLAVDEVAVSPVGGTLALISRGEGGDALHVGPPTGPFPAVLRKGGLRSPSWGPGTQGVWVLEPGPRPILWLVPAQPAGDAAQPQPVTYPHPQGAGPLSAFSVSRDGARIALVFGEGAARRLYIGRVVPDGGRLRVSGAERIAPDLVSVADVAWQDGTSLVVLASKPDLPQLVLWTLAVDGSTGPNPVQRQGLQGVPSSLAAMPGQPLTVAAELDGRSVLFRDTGSLFLPQEQPGRAPAYPG